MFLGRRGGLPPYLQWIADEEAISGRHYLNSCHWNIGETASELTWTIDEDTRTFKLIQKADITGVEIFTVPLTTLHDLQAVDIRAASGGEMAPLFVR